MKKHINVAIYTPSAIIFNGITQILGTIDDVNISITDFYGSDSDLIHSVKEIKPSILIIDPLCITPTTIRTIRATTVEKMQIIGVYSMALPTSVIRLFDATVSIYDTEESIYNILRRTCSLFSDEDQSKELTPREKDIVVGIVKGLSNKEIALEMCISVNTVMTHRRNIAAKLQIHSPAGLTIYAIASKLVNLDEIKVPTF